MTRTLEHAPEAPIAPTSNAQSHFTEIPPPRELHVPLLHPADAADTPSAKPAGTVVARGESLTDAHHPSAPAALAPVTGEVAGVTTALLPGGRAAPAIRLHPTKTPPARPEPAVIKVGLLAQRLRDLTPSDLPAWLDRLRASGIWADRWTSPDLLGQLNQCLRRPVDTVLCSALDTDAAALPLQESLALAHPLEMIAGLALLAKLTGARAAWAVIEEVVAAPRLADLVRADAESAGVRLVPVRNQYPLAHPTMLLHALVRRKLPPDELPTQHGVLLLDAAAAIAVGRRFLHDEPMLTAPVGVLDINRNQAAFAWCPIGLRLRDVLTHLGLTPRFDDRPLFATLPMRDVRPDLESVIAGSELTFIVNAPPPGSNPLPCIRCGWCIEACPVRIHPAGLLDAAQRDDNEMADRFGLDACIECGMCSYVCPSGLPLLPGIRTLRRAR